MATVLLLLFTTLVLLPVVVVIVVNVVVVVFCSCFYALRKKPIDRVMLSSALHRNLCPMPAEERSSAHTRVYAHSAVHRTGYGRVF